MKRKKTIVRPDGSREIIEEDDQAPAHHKHDLDAQKKGEPPAKQYLDRMASKGHGGDTKLAHVNQWEEALLKKLGGVGTKNPHTGLRQYFTIPGQPDDPDYLKNLMGYQPTSSTMFTSDALVGPDGSPYSRTDNGWVNNAGNVIPYGQENIGTTQSGGFDGGDTQSGGVDGGDNYIYRPNEHGVGSTRPYSPTLGGFPTTGQVAPVQGTATDGSPTDMFNIPTDIKPFSISGSQSQSGLPNQYRDQLLASLMPQLQQSITDMPGNWDKYTNEALGSYQQMMNNALRTNIPKALAGLSNRGILNSTEGQGVLGNVYSQAAMDAANKGYGTAMQAALGKANMPTVLGQIAQLGQGTNSNSFSYAEDPTVIYRDLSATIRAMMG
uniref:Uncharacterized protein n=2 Tax=viral metagenome TaxID=1070528 RepID=A0A6M3KWS9_9ZZZZ